MATTSRGLRPFQPTRFGRYTLLTPIATGGMGAVYLARMTSVEGFEKLLVIKKILPQLAQEKDFVERFVNEAKIVVKLHHGSIAQVLDMGVEEGEYYIAMEYVDGKDLRKLAARSRDQKQPFPTGQALYVTVRVLDALAYAHRKKDDQDRELNLVHRDVSPQNVLVSYEGEVKVIDFGLAKSALSLGRTNPSMVLGKFFYMSPEQARHQQVDRRSDLYAVGICLWELLAGKNPFDGFKAGEIMHAVAQPAIPSILSVRPDLPPAIEQVLSKALAVDPGERFPTAEEMRAKLTAVMLDIDPNAGPESLAGFMRTQFGREYESERKAIASLAKLTVAEPEPTPPERAEQRNPSRPPRRASSADIPRSADSESNGPATRRLSSTEVPHTDSKTLPPRSQLPPHLRDLDVNSSPPKPVRRASRVEMALPVTPKAEPEADGPPTPINAPAVEPGGDQNGVVSSDLLQSEADASSLEAAAPHAGGRGLLLIMIGVVSLLAAIAVAILVFKPFQKPTIQVVAPGVQMPVSPEPVKEPPVKEPAPPPDPAVAIPDPTPPKVEPLAPDKPLVTQPDRPRTPKAAPKTKREMLEARYAELTAEYNELRRVYPCDQIGYLCTTFKGQFDNSFERMIPNTGQYTLLEGMLANYEKILRERRRELKSSANP